MRFSVFLLISVSFIFLSCHSKDKHSHNHGHHNSKEHIPRQGHNHNHKAGDMNKKFLDPKMDVNQWKEDFENMDRDVFKNRQAIVDALNIKPGQKIADIGAGTGAFLKPLFEKVGVQGKVYAVEISPKFVDFMKKRVKKDNLTSVDVILGTSESTNLKTASADILLLVNVYHHLDQPETMLKDFKRVLKKEGRLAIVDFDKKPSASEWVKKHSRLDEQGHKKEIQQYGFKFIKKEPIPFKNNFMLVFQKQD